MKRILSVVALVVALGLTGCMTVTNEAVQLSELTANDAGKLHESYRKLVRTHFSTLRKLREQEFADRALTRYIEGAIEGGKLLQMVNGELVWDPKEKKHVKPDPNKATAQKADSINTWARTVTAEIEILRANAFSDLQESETTVLDEVDKAFYGVIRGSSTIHAYLTSLKKVEATQSELLKKIGLEDLPAKLNSALDKASTDAAKWTEYTEKADNNLMKLTSSIKEYKGK